MVTQHTPWPPDRQAFFNQLAEVVQRGVPWHAVNWVGPAPWRAFRPQGPLCLPPALAALPADFVTAAVQILLHRDADRCMRLHRVAERLLRDPRQWQDELHPEHAHLLRLQKQVRLEAHKMRAFVRFNRVEALPDQDFQLQTSEHGEQAEAPGGFARAASTAAHHVAWFDPAHHVVESVLSFFLRRFDGLPWALLTPLGSWRSDGRRLHPAPPMGREFAPRADDTESLWLTYYASIFNPARVKVAAMKKEMPVRYWSNLPEAALIDPLLAHAHQRQLDMLEHSEGDARGWFRSR